ncbi:MAG: hypothetical protein FWE33_07785 [Defluviitaleaceae bacterium]|nr:hypothetical protein [Defluviitaleaceae bacterium]
MPTMPQMPQQHGQMPIPPMPVPSQAPPMANAPNQQISPEAQDALIGKIQEFAQGEANSLRFYETLINLAGGQKDVILGLIESKKQTNQKASEFYTAALGMGWTAEETKIGEIGDYKNGLAYAKAQEAKLLREAANICVDMEHEKQRTYMNYILQNKIADITILNAL